MEYSYDPSGNTVGRATAAGTVLPHIARQPIGQVAEPGGIATFSVVVSNTKGVSYQWKFKDANLVNGPNLSGATGDSLLLTNVSAANQGQYSIMVTNSAGSTTSAPAALLLDSDRDGLPDSWEMANFGTLTGQRGEGDPDQDGASNIDEFSDGTDPSSPTSLRARLTVLGDAGGSVAVSPMKLEYNLGETVTLTATPFAPSRFVGWTGDLKSTTNPTTLTMNANKTVRGRFASPVPLPPGLVAFWRGETDASDLIGGHHGAFFAAASLTAPSVGPSITLSGKVGGAFKFDGVVHVRVPDSAALKPAEITVEAWVFPELRDNTVQTIISRSRHTWFLGCQNGKPQFGSTHFGQDSTLEAPSEIPVNEWTHLAISFDGTTKRLFVNGAQVASEGDLGVLIYPLDQIPVTIGARWTGSFADGFFKGIVDEVAIYNRALTLNEIADIYNADLMGKDIARLYFVSPSPMPDAALGVSYLQQLKTIPPAVDFSLPAGEMPPPGMLLSSTGLVSGIPSAPGIFDFTVLAADTAGISTEQLYVLQVFSSISAPYGLISWWKANGDDQDSAGTGPPNHAVRKDGAGFSAGRVNQAFALDGTKGFVQISDAPTLRPSSLTLEAWVMLEVTGGVRAIFAKPIAGTGTSDSYALWVDSVVLKGAVGDTLGMGPILQARFGLALGRWYHVAYTYDDVANEQALYVNGVLVPSPPIERVVTKSIGYDSQPLFLGRDTKFGSPSSFFGGRIDEAAIYKRALSKREIAEIYKAGAAGKHR